jgi:hypothetical protein
MVQVNDFEFHFQNIMSDFHRQEDISTFLQMGKRGTSAAKPGVVQGKIKITKGIGRDIKSKAISRFWSALRLKDLRLYQGL